MSRLNGEGVLNRTAKRKTAPKRVRRRGRKAMQ
jgi:hypothetical protein